MLRRFVLVGLLVLYQDTIMQLLLGTLLATAFLLFQVHSKGVKRTRTHSRMPPACILHIPIGLTPQPESPIDSQATAKPPPSHRQALQPAESRSRAR